MQFTCAALCAACILKSHLTTKSDAVFRRSPLMLDNLLQSNVSYFFDPDTVFNIRDILLGETCATVRKKLALVLNIIV